MGVGLVEGGLAVVGVDVLESPRRLRTARIGLAAKGHLVGLLEEGETTYTSSGPVAAAPGQRLPGSQSGNPVHAIVRMPCQATRSEPIARGWLEMTLPDIEPR